MPAAAPPARTRSTTAGSRLADHSPARHASPSQNTRLPASSRYYAGRQAEAHLDGCTGGLVRSPAAHPIRRAGKEQNRAIGALNCATKPPAADAPNRRSAADPQRTVPRNRSLSVIGHGALLVAASGILVAAHAGRRARTGARSSSRGERDAHGALPKRLHAVRPLDRHIARSLTGGSCSTGLLM